jgi:ankyrin repeat protein
LWNICSNEGIAPLPAEVRSLITGGANINFESGQWGRTVLIAATVNAHLDAVKMLLATEGIDIDAEDKSEGAPALFFACSPAHIEVAKVLFEAHKKTSNFDSIIANKNMDDAAVLHNSCYHGNVELIKLLLSVPAINIYAQDSSEETALYYARRGPGKANEDEIRALFQGKLLSLRLTSPIYLRLIFSRIIYL